MGTATSRFDVFAARAVGPHRAERRRAHTRGGVLLPRGGRGPPVHGERGSRPPRSRPRASSRQRLANSALGLGNMRSSRPVAATLWGHRARDAAQSRGAGDDGWPTRRTSRKVGDALWVKVLSVEARSASSRTPSEAHCREHAATMRRARSRTLGAPQLKATPTRGIGAYASSRRVAEALPDICAGRWTAARGLDAHRRVPLLPIAMGARRQARAAHGGHPRARTWPQRSSRAENFARLRQTGAGQAGRG